MEVDDQKSELSLTTRQTLVDFILANILVADFLVQARN